MVDAAGSDPLDPERPGFVGGNGAFCQTPPADAQRAAGTDFGKSPSDSTFRLLLAQLDLLGFETLLHDWMAAQPGVAEELDTLVCDDKTLRGSIAENDSGPVHYGLWPTASTSPR